jgi:beta-mannosidase
MYYYYDFFLMTHRISKSCHMLDGVWELSAPSRGISSIPITIPGDVHTALLSANLIPDPYYSANEHSIQWVHTIEWTISRTFEITDLSPFSAFVLSLELVDTFATVAVNDAIVLRTTNCFEFYRTDVKGYLREGPNRISLTFYPAHEEAKRRKDSLLPSFYPFADGNNKIPYMNLIRKPQFQSGWDWGPCIVPCGVYAPVCLVGIGRIELQEVAILQIWSEGRCRLDLEIDVVVYVSGERPICIRFGGMEWTVWTGKEIGKDTVKYSIEVDPSLEHWTIYEFGSPVLHELTVSVDGQEITKRIGIREIAVNTAADLENGGNHFEFVLNGRVVNAKGANLIPSDSIPSRMTRESYRRLLESMKAAHMNVVRCWGGGFYLNDVFDLADELGILVWQDLPFACAQYPPVGWFFDEVSAEFKCQIRRHRHHASIVLWCADNEDHAAIFWGHPPQEKADFWLKEYEKFNRWERTQIQALDPTRTFWPGSPSDGSCDYFGTWERETAGDIHFWQVWHGRKPFESFFSVKPRFCSEFGYQSYPSLPTLQKILPCDGFDLNSDAFKNHQKNAGGDGLIANMFSTYFTLPNTFVEHLYLSQVQQAFAIRMGCEFWRTCKPITRGILYWQLNDCWPASSWSSIEYGGRWRQLHYHARRFFAPILATFQEWDFLLRLWVVSDLMVGVAMSGNVQWICFDGEVIRAWELERCTVKVDSAEVVWEIPSEAFDGRRGDGFFFASFAGEGIEEFSNFFFPARFKDSAMVPATIHVSVTQEGTGSRIALTTDKPAFFVHLESEKVNVFSDSSFVLLPGSEKIVTCEEIIRQDDLTVYELNSIGRGRREPQNEKPDASAEKPG